MKTTKSVPATNGHVNRIEDIKPAPLSLEAFEAKVEADRLAIRKEQDRVLRLLLSFEAQVAYRRKELEAGRASTVDTLGLIHALAADLS